MIRLPIQLSRDITFHLTHAYPYLVINSSTTYADLLNEHYMQSIAKVFESGWLETDYLDGFAYGSIDNLDSRILKTCMFSCDELSFRDEIKLICRLLHDGYYVVAFVDEFYLPKRLFTNYKHFTHEFLIYGYDEEEIYAIGYDINRHFSKLQFPLRSFKSALKASEEALQLRDACSWPHDKTIIGMRPVPRNEEYVADHEVIRNKIDEYMNGKHYNQNAWLFQSNPELGEKEKSEGPSISMYGRNTYLIIKKHLNIINQKLINGKQVHFDAYYPHIHFFYEQSLMTLHRAEYVNDGSQKAQDIQKQLKHDSEILDRTRRLYLKAEIVANNTNRCRSIVERMINEIDELYS